MDYLSGPTVTTGVFVSECGGDMLREAEIRVMWLLAFKMKRSQKSRHVGDLQKLGKAKKCIFT